jgi:hypothetical protein
MCPVAKDKVLVEGGSSTSNTSVYHLHIMVEHLGIVMLTGLWRIVLQDVSGSLKKQ